MKKLFSMMMCLGVALTAMAQTNESGNDVPKNEKIAHAMKPNKWFNHLDFAVTAGSAGFGFDLSAPMTDWARIRLGASFRPLETYSANFGVEMSEGLSKEINDERFEKIQGMVNEFAGFKPNKSVSLQGALSMNNFKCLVDIFPFKNNRHWYVTAGFYYGNSTLIEAKNTAESMNTLLAVGLFNTMYRNVLDKRSPINLKSQGIDIDAIKNDKLEKYKREMRGMGKINDPRLIQRERTIDYTYVADGPFGSEVISDSKNITEYGYYDDDNKFHTKGAYAEYGISIPIGLYKHDVIAKEDIYYAHDERLEYEAGEKGGVYDRSFGENLKDLSVNSDEFHYQKDENGRYIKKGSIRYRKGEVIHKAGEEFRIVPDENNTVKVKSEASKFKPYFGVGYETSLGKDKRAKIGINAGLMMWTSSPTVSVSTPIGMDADGGTVYMSVDMTKDLRDMRTAVNDYVKIVQRYPVFPDVSARFSYRLW